MNFYILSVIIKTENLYCSSLTEEMRWNYIVIKNIQYASFLG